MTYKISQHTADVRLELKNKTLKGLFSDAIWGMLEISKPEYISKKIISNKIKVTAPDATALLIDFLNEVLYLNHTEKKAFHKIAFEKLNDRELVAEIFGQEIKFFNEDIKAATYHEAAVTKNKKGDWETVVIFDI